MNTDNRIRKEISRGLTRMTRIRKKKNG